MPIHFDIWNECYHYWLDEGTMMPDPVDLHFLQHKGSNTTKIVGQVRLVLWVLVVWNVLKTHNSVVFKNGVFDIQDMLSFLVGFD